MLKPQASKGFSAKELAEAIDAEVVGSADAVISGICPLDDQQTGQITFVTKTTAPKLLELLRSATATAFIVPSSVELPEVPEGSALLTVEDPMSAMVKLIPVFYTTRETPRGIHPSAVVAESSTLGENVSIGPYCCIDADCKIGNNTVLFPHVVIYPGVEIGANVIIHSGAVIREESIIGDGVIVQNGAVIGADGFGYLPDRELGLRPIPQVGVARIDNRVEVGANSCIDRATLGTTRIGTGSKLDNLVQIGHNVTVGSHSAICGHVGIAGSCKIGSGVTLGGHAGIADHVTIGDSIRVAGGARVTSELREPGDYGGFPAVPVGKWRRQLAAIAKLPAFMKSVRKESKS